MQRQLALVQQKVRECEEIYRGDLQVILSIIMLLVVIMMMTVVTVMMMV